MFRVLTNGESGFFFKGAKQERLIQGRKTIPKIIRNLPVVGGSVEHSRSTEIHFA